MLALLISVSPLTNKNNADAQISDIMVDVDVDSCSSASGCEVITRQYTGITVRYSISIRCSDSGGNYGDWSYWTYEGINPGTYCN